MRIANFLTEERTFTLSVHGLHDAKIEVIGNETVIDGKPAITVGIIKQAVANPLDVSKAVRAVMPEVNQSLPQGLSDHRPILVTTRFD